MRDPCLQTLDSDPGMTRRATSCTASCHVGATQLVGDRRAALLAAIAALVSSRLRQSCATRLMYIGGLGARLR